MASELTASDVALLGGNHMGWGGDGWGSSMMWIFALLILAGGGFGGLGFGNNAAAIGYENLATSNEVQRGFDNQNLQAQTRDILAAVNAGTAQSVAATNQVFHDVVGFVGDKYSELTRDVAGLAVGQANLLAKENECCCTTLRAIDGVNYNGAMNTSAIQRTIVEEGQKTRDLFVNDRMAQMQNKINQLELRQAVTGVVRYPMQTTYSSGCNPFCNCGYGM